VLSSYLPWVSGHEIVNEVFQGTNDAWKNPGDVPSEHWVLGFQLCTLWR
jgi:hypothetical protein